MLEIGPEEQEFLDYLRDLAARRLRPRRRKSLVLRKAQPASDTPPTDAPKKTVAHLSHGDLKRLGLRWVTAHPNGEHPGVPILVRDLGDDESMVVGGAGGTLNFTRFRRHEGEQTRKQRRTHKEPTRELTPEEQQKLQTGTAREKETRHAIRDYILHDVMGGAVGEVSPEDEKRLRDRAIQKAAKLGLGDEETQQFATAYVKKHGSERKAAARDAVDKAVRQALEAQAHEALTGTPHDAGEIEVGQTTDEQEHGDKPPASVKLTREHVEKITSLAAERARAADELRSLRRLLHTGDEKTIRAVELAYEPLSPEDAKRYAVQQHLGLVEIENNVALVNRTDKPGSAMAQRIANGAADGAAGMSAELAGNVVLDAKTAKDLGVLGAARVLARYLIDKGSDAKATAAGLRDFIGEKSASTAAEAVKYSDQMGKNIEQVMAFAYKEGEEPQEGQYMAAVQANAKSLEYRNEAINVLGRALGGLEMAAQTALALEQGAKGNITVSGRDSEAATREKASSLGLTSGDYSLRKTSDGYQIDIHEAAVPKLYHEQDLQQYRERTELDDLRDESAKDDGFDDWQPDGQSDSIRLASYQKGNIKFWERQGRVLITDEAGAGKTFTALCGIAHLAEQGNVKKALLVVPKSVTENFGSELRVSLDPKYHDNYRVIGGMSKAQRDKAYSGDQLFTVITHDQLRNDEAAIKAAGFDAAVIDEAHYFTTRSESKGETAKVNTSQRTAAAKRVTEGMGYLMLMTGTPIKNSVSELHSLVDWAQPGTLGSRAEFMRRFGDLATRKGIFDKAAERELADRLSGTMMGMKLTSDAPGGGVRLKPTTNKSKAVLMFEHTRFVKPSPEQTKAYREEEVRYREKNRAGEKYSPFTRDQHHKRTVNNVNIDDHPKVLAMRKDLATHPDEKKVIFAANTYSWNTIIKGLGLKRGEYLFLTGDTSDEQRKAIQDKINDPSDAAQVLVASDAANFGMNLQGASVLVNYDATDTYATHIQRIAREFRQKQQHDVTVYNYRTDTPLEVKAEQRIRGKENVAGLPQRLSQADSSGFAEKVYLHLNEDEGATANA